MKISWFAAALWAAGFAEQAGLLLVLLARARWRKFRFFTALIAFNVTRTVVLFSTYRLKTPRLYEHIYWTATGIDLFLQILVILEAVRIVLAPAGIWGEDVRRRFRGLAVAGVLIAAALPFTVHPHMPKGIGDWVEQGELFSAALFLVLFVAMRSSTTVLGVAWRSHVQALATGWGVWAIVDFFVEGAYSYFGGRWHGMHLDYVRILTYQLVTVYWAVMFWIPEPERGTLTPEQQEYLFALQKHAEEHARLLGGNPEK